MILHCCDAMRSGSALLFSLVDRLTEKDFGGYHFGARVDNPGKLNTVLRKYRRLHADSHFPTLGVNGAFSPEIFLMLPRTDTYLIFSLHAAADCMGSVNARWDYRRVETAVELQEVLDNLDRSMNFLNSLPNASIIVFDYPQLFSNPEDCLLEVSRFLGIQLRSINDYSKLCDTVRTENEPTSCSKALRLSRWIKDYKVYAICSSASRYSLPDFFHNRLAWTVRTRILKKYLTHAYIGPSYISSNGGVPGTSVGHLDGEEILRFRANIDTLDEKKISAHQDERNAA